MVTVLEGLLADVDPTAVGQRSTSKPRKLAEGRGFDGDAGGDAGEEDGEGVGVLSEGGDNTLDDANVAIDNEGETLATILSATA